MSASTPLDALIVGAGPTGLTLAGALLRRGLRIRLVDSALASTSFSKAIGIQTRTMETFELLGLADAFVAAGLPISRASFASAGREIGQVSFESLDSPYPYILTLPQSDTEEILGAWVTRLGGQIERGVTLETFTQHTDRQPSHAPIVATLRHADGASEQIEAAWLIGCDGAHSRVRHLVGATFHGAAYPGTYALADVRLEWERPPDRARIFFHPEGLLAAFPLPSDRYRLIMDTTHGPNGSNGSIAVSDTSAETAADGASEASHPPAPTLDEVAAIVTRRTEDAEARLSDPRWLASFRTSARSVDHTRFGRVFLVGDAAHIHSPAGGQGMNTGIQDALNLGWKLTLVQRGLAHDALLDSYEGERRPIAEAVIRESDTLLRAATLRNPLMRFGRDSVFSLFTALPLVERRLVRQIAEVTITYRRSSLTQPGPALTRGPHPGDFIPEVDGLLTPAGESSRLAALLRGGASLLLTFAPEGGPTREQMRELAAAIQPWGDALTAYRVAPSLAVTSAADASHALPTLADPKGALRRTFGNGDDTSALILIRPDGYLALRAEGARSIEALRAYTTRALGSS